MCQNSCIFLQIAYRHVLANNKGEKYNLHIIWCYIITKVEMIKKKKKKLEKGA